MLAALPAILLLSIATLPGKGLGYVFSGGGARGFAQLGMIKVLEEEGIYPDHVMGSSVGSVLGGLYALGYTAAEVESLMVTLDMADIINENQARPDLHPGARRWPSYGNLRLALSPKGMPRAPAGAITGAKIDLGLAGLFMPAAAYRDFSRLPVNFAGLTIDMHTGELVIHREGSLAQAVRGAASIPAVISPFTYDGRTHIDGGLLQNLPVPQVIDLGADKILALKINTSMRGADPKDLYSILNHIINIAMHTSIDANVELCDLILEPDLTGIGNLAYPKAHAITQIGEDYARANIDVIRAFRDSLLAEGYVFTKPERITELTSVPVTEIVTRGNSRVLTDKIITWSGLREDTEYLPKEILDACSRVWNSQKFHTVYPVLEPLDSGYRLVLYVSEREPRYLHINTSYSSDEKFCLGAAAEFNDLILPNSRLLGGFTLGGRNELNLDFVKDFGDFHAPYLRLHPWLRQSRVYRYDASGQRTASLDSLEYGVVPGVGFFADKLFSLEAFGYFSRAKTTGVVPDGLHDSTWQNDSGLGLKLYHESLDTDVFPRSGARFFAKAELSPWPALSAKNYTRLTANLDVYAPLAKYVSLRVGFAYGSHYGSFADNFTDLINFGGAEGFSGYRKGQAPSAEYKYGTLSAVFEPLTNLFLETGAQALNTAGNADWSLDNSLFFSYYAGLGYRSPVGPLGVKLALREDGKTNFYFNIGYTTDLFWFSRK
ncbi:MAG: patatin-like phospholipase family protein [Candidatus Cloacimonetes bacterium]|nr:patatin-like phospholipase family protein [Candidatus Cloacimonadota bacterium]